MRDIEYIVTATLSYLQASDGRTSR